MASLQPYQSHRIKYYRIVESFRKEGKPHIRVLAHLGRVDDILELHRQQKEVPVKVSSVSAGAVTALHLLARKFDVAGRINRAIAPDGDVQVRDELTAGESNALSTLAPLLAAMIARACAPRSKRAFATWAKTTYLPDLMNFVAADLTSQHFNALSTLAPWDQMNVVPADKLAGIEQELVREVVLAEQLQLKALAYDTTNFHTHIATTNLRPKLPQRGKNKQGRSNLRQLGLALVVDQDTQLPLAHVLYEGARSDMKTFAEFLKPIRKRLRELTGQPEQLTIVFDAGSSSQKNLDEMAHYVTAVRPSGHRALLAEAAGQLIAVQLSTGAELRAWRTTRSIAGKQREVVVVFSPKLHEGQLRGLHQSLARAHRDTEKMGLHPKLNAEAAKRKLNKIRGRQYLRSLLCYEVGQNEKGTVPVCVWSDWGEYWRKSSKPIVDNRK